MIFSRKFEEEFYPMLDMTRKFELLYGSKKLEVTPVKAGGNYVFVVKFTDGTRHPLSLTRASGMDKPKFWTSIPEGRQKEAEAIGPFITAHYQEHAAVK